ncbi:MAG: IS66 family transposase [Dehalococcoidales bacterium]|nr:IS66 family transposase [Dehalococcoidales bacterium]
MDTKSIRSKTLEAYQQGPDAVVEFVDRLVAEFVTQLEALSTRVSAMEIEIANLKAENAALRARLSSNSRNSSKPPSSDGPGIKPHPKSQRKTSGRKSGGQPGHAGHTLRLVDDPDEVKVHAPSNCGACGRSLQEVPVVRRERRQVVDIPPVKAAVIEHQAETKRCPCCGEETSGAFPEDVAGPTQYGPGVATTAVYLNQEQLLPVERTCEVMADLFGCPIAEGTLQSAVARCHEGLAETEASIKSGIEKAAVAHFDETGMNVDGKNFWLHVASNEDLTYYSVHPKRGQAAMDAIDLLPKFQGRAIHDGMPSYWRYEECEHGLCNAHHLRELTFVEEELGQSWAKDMKELLLEIKEVVDEARDRGMARLSGRVKRRFNVWYDWILEMGMKANPPPEPTGKRGRPKRGKAGSLVDRLREHKGAVLAFMEDFTVPFDNNQAERDLRMMKVREKISGCFRTVSGAERFCRIRGYISTMRKQGISVADALRQVISGTPIVPATASATPC